MLKLLTYPTVALLLSSFSIFGCQNSTPRDSGLVDPELFGTIYLELVLAALDTAAVDSAGPAKAVLEAHDITPQVLTSSIERYRQKPEIWLKIMSQVTEKLEEKKNASKAPEVTPKK